MEEYIRNETCRAKCEKLEQEDRRQNERLKELEKTVEVIHHLTVSTERLASSMERMLDEQKKQGEEQKEQGRRIAALENAPAKKWDKLTWIAISTLVTAILGFIVGKIF